MPRELILAKTAGLCYGVKRAVKLATELAEQQQGGHTLGELIHNNDVKNALSAKGITVANTVADCQQGKTVIIRSHGVGRAVYSELEAAGIDYIDATCPDVKKLHKLIYDKTSDNANVIITGDVEHPEIKATLAHKSDNGGSCFVVNSPEELESLLKTEKSFVHNPLIIFSQTTFDRGKWQECKEIIKKYYTKAEIFDTICSATINRQEEARQLSEKCDIMIVLGGPHSSNSKKLADICGEITKTIFVENVTQLRQKDLSMLLSGSPDIKIGITAGASTPAEIIKEVHSYMSEELKNAGAIDEDMAESMTDIDFMAEVDKTFKRIYIGNRVRAYVVAVNNAEAVVDLGTKHSGYIPANELTDDPNLAPSDVVSPGDEIDCIVTSINDAEGVVYLSKKRVDAALGFEKISSALEENKTLDGVVTGIVKGGIIVICEGARVFVPASQTGVPRNGKLEELNKKNVKIKIIEVNAERNRVVGSIRAAAKEVNEARRAEFWSKIEVGQKFTGEIKSIESYGVFVDLGGVDGMVHLSELTWNRIKHPKEVVSIGDKLDVYVKSFDAEKKRVSLGAKDPNDNPWVKFQNDFEVGDVVKAQIVSITPFGAFAQIIPGVDGLVHISQISAERVTNVAQALTVGQVVDAKITEIDIEKSRVSLSMKALLETYEAEAAEEEAASTLAYSDDDVAPEEA